MPWQALGAWELGWRAVLVLAACWPLTACSGDNGDDEPGSRQDHGRRLRRADPRPASSTRSAGRRPRPPRPPSAAATARPSRATSRCATAPATTTSSARPSTAPAASAPGKPADWLGRRHGVRGRAGNGDVGQTKVRGEARAATWSTQVTVAAAQRARTAGARSRRRGGRAWSTLDPDRVPDRLGLEVARSSPTAPARRSSPARQRGARRTRLRLSAAATSSSVASVVGAGHARTGRSR